MWSEMFIPMPFVVCLTWTAILGLGWRGSDGAKHLLTCFMGVATVLYFCHLVFFTQHGPGVWVANTVYSFCNIAVFPLFYIYVRRLTHVDVGWRYLVLTPAVVFFVWTLVLYLFFPDALKAMAVKDYAARCVFLLQLFPVGWFGYRDLKAFDLEVENLYADTEGRTVRDIRQLIPVLLGGSYITDFQSDRACFLL